MIIFRQQREEIFLKKVIALNTSRRKFNTFRALKSLEIIFKEEKVEYEIINLHDYKIDYCKGCETCIIKDFCPIDDDVQKINEKLISADGIIFSTPVYMENISGILKTYIDRNCKWYHRSELLKKPYLAIATTNGSGLKRSLDYLDLVATRWGMVPCGKIGRTFRKHMDEITRKETGQFIEFVKNPDNIKQWISPSKYINYSVQKSISMNLFEIDREFWKKNGIDKGYYYNYITDPFSKLMGNFLFKMLSKKLIESKNSREQNF